ncbi:lactate permease LctP family transporter [Desulfotomaculum varum]
MEWTQVINPFDNLFLSALVAAIPILFMFYALAIARMKGHIAGSITLLLAIGVAVFVHGMPAQLAIWSSIYGALYGLFPIGWIVLTAVFLYQLTVKSGQFEIIKDSIAAITDDRRLQALLIAFCFGAFLEGAAGFGTPVAITAGMLVGLGFNPLYAAGLCLIANTAPVAFGGIGIPIITAGAVSGVDTMAISQMVGRQLPFLSVFVPFWLVFIMAGWKGAKEVMPAILVCGVSFAAAQWFSANYMSPMLPDIISSLVSIVAMVLFLRKWKPKNVWRFKDEPPATLEVRKHSFGTIAKAWSPFIVLTILIGDWGLKSVKTLLDVVTIKIPFDAINKMIIAGGKPIEVVYKFNYLSAAGTAILISAIITAFILKISFGDFIKTFQETVKSLVFPLITIACVLAFAYVANWSGMTPTLGKAFTVTGALFPLVAPILGWLGVFVTGSDTSANALFGKMQAVTAADIGVDPVLTVAANSSGGVAAKMISPQSIAVATAACNLVGKEGDLFRFTVLHSLFFTAIICVITYLQAYVLTWMIPVYETAKQAVAKASPQAAAAAEAALRSQGTLILAVTAVVVLVIAVYAYKQAGGGKFGKESAKISVH